MGLELLVRALDELVATDPAELADRHSVRVLYAQAARLESVVAGASAAFERSGRWKEDGARSSADWLAVRCHTTRRAAGQMVEAGTTASELPAVKEAWGNGEVTKDTVASFAQLERPSNHQALVRDQDELVARAKELPVSQFKKAAFSWDRLADPEGAEAAAADRRARRDVAIGRDPLGMWEGRLRLDAVSGEIVASELERLGDLLFRAEWKEAKDRLGTEPSVGDLARTPAQRRADALVEMATRSRSTPPGSRRPEPLYTVVVGLETLAGPVCELASGCPLTPGDLVPQLSSSWFERLVYSPTDRPTLSERARIYAGADKRQAEVEDDTCAHDLCLVPARFCEVDHKIPYAKGGPTTADNAQLLCTPHNRAKGATLPPTQAPPGTPSGQRSPPHDGPDPPPATG